MYAPWIRKEASCSGSPSKLCFAKYFWCMLFKKLAKLTGRSWGVEIEKNIGRGAYQLGEKTLLFKVNVS